MNLTHQLVVLERIDGGESIGKVRAEVSAELAEVTAMMHALQVAMMADIRRMKEGGE